MAMLPFAALSLGAVRSALRDISVEKLVGAWKSFLDSGNYAMILPPVGSQQLSYAKFLQLLSHRKIKRIILMDNATCAIVEVGCLLAPFLELHIPKAWGEIVGAWKSPPRIAVHMQKTV